MKEHNIYYTFASLWAFGFMLAEHNGNGASQVVLMSWSGGLCLLHLTMGTISHLADREEERKKSR